MTVPFAFLSFLYAGQSHSIYTHGVRILSNVLDFCISHLTCLNLKLTSIWSKHDGKYLINVAVMLITFPDI